MKYNKDLLIKKFNEKNYSECIEMLTDEIIILLTEKIKKSDNNFTYKNLSNLKHVSSIYLDNENKKNAIKFCDLLQLEDLKEEYVLDELLAIYKDFSKD